MGEKIRVSKSGIVRKGKGKVEPRHTHSLTSEACQHARSTGARVDTTDHNLTARDRRTSEFLLRAELDEKIVLDR